MNSDSKQARITGPDGGNNYYYSAFQNNSFSCPDIFGCMRMRCGNSGGAEWKIRQYLVELCLLCNLKRWWGNGVDQEMRRKLLSEQSIKSKILREQKSYESW